MFAFPYQHLRLNVSPAELSFLLPPLLSLPCCLSGLTPLPAWLEAQTPDLPLFPIRTPPWHGGQLSAGPWRPVRKTSSRLLALLQPIPPLPAPLSSCGLELPDDRLPKSGQRKSPTRHGPNSAWHLIPKKGLYELQQVAQLVAFCLSWRYNENQKSVLRCDGSWCIVQTCRLVRSRGWNLLCGLDLPPLLKPSSRPGSPRCQPPCSVTVIPARPFQVPAQIYTPILSPPSQPSKTLSSDAALKTHLAHVLTSQKVQRRLGRSQPSPLSAPTYTKVHCCNLEKNLFNTGWNFFYRAFF